MVLNKFATPLVGATIREVETSKQTQTDEKGYFSLEMQSKNSLEFSIIGYQKQVIKFESSGQIQVVLQDQMNVIDQLVVTAYGKANAKNFTGSLEQVNQNVLSKTAAASFETAFQGNVAGINVYTTGQPAASSNVQIRGVGSLSGLKEPLYVLDGVVMNSDNTSRIGGNGAINQINPLASINTQDIENISILKDAAAASLYGSRAANGVIVITTKRGKKGYNDLSFAAKSGLLDNLTQEKTINGQDFKRLWQMGQRNRYIQNEEESDFFRVYNNPDLYNKYQAMAEKDYLSNYGPGQGNYDWLNAIYRLGNINQYALSANAGGEKTQFYISGEYLKQNGTIIKADLERKSGRLNVDNQTKPWLHLAANLSVAKSDRNAGQYDSEYVGGLNPLFMARALPQVAPIYDPEGYKGLADLPNLIEKNANPIGVIEVGKYNNQDLRLRGSVWAELLLPYALKFKSTLGVDHQSLEETLYDNKVFGAGSGQWNGALYVSQGQLSQYTSSNLLTYNKIIAEHNFDALLGFEAQESKMKSINNSGYDILDSELLSSSSIGTLWSWNGQSENYALLSYFSRLNYGFSDKYFISGSIRRDGSSRFGRDSRWGNFWSVSGAWVVSEENFLKNTVLSYLKVRGSYGTNGNLPPDYYASLAFFTTAGKSYAAESGLSYGQLANPDLSWELSKNSNIGIDGQIHNRLAFSLEYFQKQTTNLLMNIPVSGTTGFTTQLQNYGEMINKGWEFSLKYRLIEDLNFSWDTKLNAT
ncbi:MAG: SusC/RagA family TonB-linked outer membrane protein, partial [Sphingobacterium sp.]